MEEGKCWPLMVRVRGGDPAPTGGGGLDMLDRWQGWEIMGFGAQGA